MIQLMNCNVYGWEAALRGMRNPKNSWDRSDTNFVDGYIPEGLGEVDLALAQKLADAGPVHGKYLRMITVTVDILAPLYWWKEFDTYKVGTVSDSCSTMHKIHDKEFHVDDFSHEHLGVTSMEILQGLVRMLNVWRKNYLISKDKRDWWQMIQLLPSSYNQLRTVQVNYAVLKNIYQYRKNHKLDEWRDLCEWIEKLPYSCLITGVES